MSCRLAVLTALAIAVGAAHVARAHPGDPDPTFGPGGYVVTTVPGIRDANALALQPDGKLVAAGNGFPGMTTSRFGLARFDSSGALDPTFGGGLGYVTTLIADGVTRLDELALQTDGKLVAAGGATVGGNSDIALARYNADGTLDMSFGSGGVVTGPALPGDQIARGAGDSE